MYTGEHRCPTDPNRELLGGGAAEPLRGRRADSLVRCLRVIALLSALFAGSCSKTPPAADSTTGVSTGVTAPEPQGGGSAAQADAGATTEPDGGSAPPAPAEGLLAGQADALHPSIVAAGGDWLVAWEDNDGSSRRLLVSTVAAGAQGEAPIALAAGPAARGARLAARDANVLAVCWTRAPHPPSLRERSLPTAPRRRTGEGLGRRHAARLPDARHRAGGRLAVPGRGRTSAPRSRRRRRSCRDGRLAGRRSAVVEIEGREPPPTERAQPTPSADAGRPERRSARALVAPWESEQIMGRDAHQRTRVARRRRRACMTPNMPVSGLARGLRRRRRRQPVAVQAFHNPNGGPWELSIRPLGRGEAEAPFPASRNRTRLSSGPPTASSSLGPPRRSASPWSDHLTARCPTSVLPCAAPPGEAEVALAADGTTVRVAWIDRDGARSVVRTAAWQRHRRRDAPFAPPFVALPFETDIPRRSSRRVWRPAKRRWSGRTTPSSTPRHGGGSTPPARRSGRPSYDAWRAARTLGGRPG